MLDVEQVNKAIEIMNSLKIVKYDELQTKKMLEALKKSDYSLAVECLEAGAAPNVSIFNTFEERFETVFSIMLSNRNEDEILINFDEFLDRYDEDDDNRFESKSYESYKLVHDFLEKWKEKGGSFNAKAVSFDNGKKGFENQKIRDVLFSEIFLDDKDLNYQDSLYFYYTTEQIGCLKKISEELSEKIEPLFVNKPVLSSVLKEVWSSKYTFIDLLSILNINSEDLLLNKETGNTVLHTKLDMKLEEANYYKGKYRAVDYKSLIDNYANLIDVLPQELLLVKNKEGLLPYEYFAENKCWVEFLLITNAMKKNSYTINLTDKIVDLFPVDLTDLNIISDKFKKEDCAEVFKEIISLREKKLLEQSFEGIKTPKKANRI